MDAYALLQNLGSGTYGEILLAKNQNQKDHTKNEDPVVLKRILLSNHTYEQELAAFALMQAQPARCPHIVQLLHHFTAPHHGVLVLEYIPGGDLYAYLQTHDMSVDAVRHAMRQVWQAVYFCHHLGLVLGDIKPENILVMDPDHPLLTLKLCDFGMAATTTTHTVMNGTLHYLAPETIKVKERTFKTDAWQTGILCFELLTKTSPFDALDPMQTVTQILKQPLTFPATVPSDAQHLLSNLLSKTPIARFTVHQALTHPFSLPPPLLSSPLHSPSPSSPSSSPLSITPPLSFFPLHAPPSPPLFDIPL